MTQQIAGELSKSLAEDWLNEHKHVWSAHDLFTLTRLLDSFAAKARLEEAKWWNSADLTDEEWRRLARERIWRLEQAAGKEK